VTPAITGETEIISKSCRQYLSNIPGKHEIKELQKTAIMGTAHIPHKYTGIKVHNVHHEK
jgi:hypothetical protein